MQAVVTQHYNRHQFDRLGLTIFFALAVHAIVILGVSFNADDLFKSDDAPTMEITLVSSQSKEAPDEADYLAQANQKGGGNVDKKVRPTSPLSNPDPTAENGLAPDSKMAFSPPKLKKKDEERKLMTAEKSPFSRDSKEFQRDIPVSTKSEQAAQMFERSREFARLHAEIQEMKQAFERTPHHTYVTGLNAKEYRFASYIEAWRDKVEKFGSLNYPEDAIRNNISGSLLLDVGVNPDGSIQSMNILRSSGHKVLDNAATQIVKMAAPFPPLTQAILKDTDILHISLVWRFRVKQGLTTSIN
ncbi:MAG: TonB family protein [Gammaproteobacteria bacterium]|nr:TonB family protein [Gammaproteobacteria bacterium]